jgi:hypothetical protein
MVCLVGQAIGSFWSRNGIGGQGNHLIGCRFAIKAQQLRNVPFDISL